MHTRTFRAILTGVLVCCSAEAGAQASFSPDSAQYAAMLAQAMSMNQPAAFILRHRDDLRLTTSQVAALQSLALAERDSARVRQARLASRMQATPPSAAMVAMGSWTGALDEAAIRDALCQQSILQSDFVLGLARDRRAAAALLTTDQSAKLMSLQMNDMVGSMKRP